MTRNWLVAWQSSSMAVMWWQ